MMDRTEAEVFMREQAESGMKLRTIAILVLLTPLSLALAIPTLKALWTAVDSIPDDLYPILGIVLFGGMVLLGLVTAGMAALRWIAQPGNQLPAPFRHIEDWAEGGE